MCVCVCVRACVHVCVRLAGRKRSRPSDQWFDQQLRACSEGGGGLQTRRAPTFTKKKKKTSLQPSDIRHHTLRETTSASSGNHSSLKDCYSSTLAGQDAKMFTLMVGNEITCLPWWLHCRLTCCTLDTCTDLFRVLRTKTSTLVLLVVSCEVWSWAWHDGAVSSSVTIKLSCVLNCRGRSFTLCVCLLISAILKNTIANSRDSISNEHRCVFLPKGWMGKVTS